MMQMLFDSDSKLHGTVKITNKTNQYKYQKNNFFYKKHDSKNA